MGSISLTAGPHFGDVAVFVFILACFAVMALAMAFVVRFHALRSGETMVHSIAKLEN